MRLRLLLAFLATAVGVLGLASTAAATTTTTEVVRFPITQPFHNTCNDDMVLIVGTMQTQVHITATDGGKLLFETSNWTKDIDASSTVTGQRYVYNEEYGDVTQTYQDGGFTARQRSTINLIQVGEDGSLVNDDLHVHFTFTVRFDADGNYTTEENFDFDCH